MNETINNFNQKELSGRDARLWKEWKELDTLCRKRKMTSANPRQPSLSISSAGRMLWDFLRSMKSGIVANPLLGL